MLDLEFYAMMLQQAREDTVFKKAALLGPFDSELEREQARRRNAGFHPVHWLGSGLTRLGRRLTEFGERLAPPRPDGSQPIA